MITDTSNRKYELDWLRVLAILFVSIIINELTWPEPLRPS